MPSVSFRVFPWFPKKHPHPSVLICVHPWFENPRPSRIQVCGSDGTSPSPTTNPSVFPNSIATTHSSNRNRPLTRRRSQKHAPENHPSTSIRVDRCPSVVLKPQGPAASRFAAQMELRPPRQNTIRSLKPKVHQQQPGLRLRWNFALPQRNNLIGSDGTSPSPRKKSIRGFKLKTISRVPDRHRESRICSWSFPANHRGLARENDPC